jgi:hypothetical protein
MAHAGYIIIKGGGADSEQARNKPRGYRAFYGPLDKGSAKPSFCYPDMKRALQEEISGMEKSLKDGYVAETRVMKVKEDLRKKRERLSGILEQEENAHKLFKENKDACMKRRDEIAPLIAAGLPSAKDVEKGRVNPHRILADEKAKGLGELKREYQVLSHLAGEESNTSFLQRD